MKRNNTWLLLLFITIFSGLFARDFAQDDYKIYLAASGEEISLPKMATQLADYDVIFFGEWHDDILLHKLQADILPLLDSKIDLTISMEMFERDVQPVLDDFLADKITQVDFLEKSRAWGNYLTDYKPIVDYAKQNELDVIAANIPRRYASMISKQGVNALDELSAEEKSFVAKELKALDNQYKKQFMETMAANMGRKNAMGISKMLENIYAAQCIKDDTMAESIFEYLQNNPSKSIIHYNGNFHSESHLGTANKLRLLDPQLKIAVITPVIVGDKDKIRFDPEAKDLGDFLIFAKRFVREEQATVADPKMFHNLSNTILQHEINLSITPEKRFLSGYDQLTLSREITQQDTFLLLSALEISEIRIDDKPVQFMQRAEDEAYREISFKRDFGSKVLKIFYSGEIYFPLKGRNLNQTHDGTKGMISAKEDEGIYLPGASWYPFTGEGLADFDITVSCPEDFSLLTSGAETLASKDGKKIYNWKSELPVEHLSLVGNRFVINSRKVNEVELRTYLLAEDAQFASTYLAEMEKYLQDYSELFGEYPFSSFSVVENFFASGFGMPNYTLLAKEIVKMPFITLSPGVIAHEFCHNWWGNSVYVDYENGNWCEALTVFSANYYQNILSEDKAKAVDWRKKAILENNLLPQEKQFPLRDFVYQHNDDEAVIGYQKGAMLFVYLYEYLGESAFGAAVQDFYALHKAKVADWNDLKTSFLQHVPKQDKEYIEQIFSFWLNSTELPSFALQNINYSAGEITGELLNNSQVALSLPIRISYAEYKIDQQLFLEQGKNVFSLASPAKPVSIEIDPDAYLLKKISEQSMPFSLSKTLNDSPLVVLPEQGEMVGRLQMVASMLARSGYDINIKSASELTSAELKNNSLLILGEYENNSIYQKLALPAEIKLTDSSIMIDDQQISGEKGSAIISFAAPENSDKNVSIYLWNSAAAISSFRKMFHYMNDSWQLFDLDQKENGALASGQIFPAGKNDLKHDF